MFNNYYIKCECTWTDEELQEDPMGGDEGPNQFEDGETYSLSDVDDMINSFVEDFEEQCWWGDRDFDDRYIRKDRISIEIDNDLDKFAINYIDENEVEKTLATFNISVHLYDNNDTDIRPSDLKELYGHIKGQLNSL